jgi:hypothetical protein
MAKLRNLLLFLCAGQARLGDATDTSEVLSKHWRYANEHYTKVYKWLGTDFKWLQKNEYAKSMVAESMSTESEGCFTSCVFGKNYHLAACALGAEKVFPLIYGRLLKRGSGDEILCDKVKEPDKDFTDTCLKECRYNTAVAIVSIVNEAERMIDGKAPDSGKAEEEEDANMGSKMEFSGGSSRLYAIDEGMTNHDGETTDHKAMAEGFAKSTQLPLWASMVMIATMLGMARQICSLKKQIAQGPVQSRFEPDENLLAE